MNQHYDPHLCTECGLCICGCRECTSLGMCMCMACPCDGESAHICTCPPTLAMIEAGE